MAQIRHIGEWTIITDDKTVEVRIINEAEDIGDFFEVMELVLSLLDEGYKLKTGEKK